MFSSIPLLIEDGKLIKPGLGVSLADSRISERLGVKGMIIVEVYEGSGAYKAGLRPTQQYGGEIILGDIIKKVDGNGIRDFDDIRDSLEKHSVGDRISITIEREGVEMDISVELSSIN